MSIINGKERLYLTTWGYNAARILSSLANIIELEGGKTSKPNGKLVSDRDNKEQTEPIEVSHTTYISFVLDGDYYYYQMDDNPFFPFYYVKAPVVDGVKYPVSYLTEENKDWGHSFYEYSQGVFDADINALALLLFHKLQNAKPTGTYREKHRVQVPNTYNNRCHYEVKEEKQEYKKIDF